MLEEYRCDMDALESGEARARALVTLLEEQAHHLAASA
jgi:hypothetical protein